MNRFTSFSPRAAPNPTTSHLSKAATSPAREDGCARNSNHIRDASMVKLNPDKVPRPLVHLIPIAEKWALDGYIDAVSNASSEELEALVHCIDDVADLFGWLAGPEADNPNPSLEYVAFTDLTQAIDLARLLLKKRQGHKVVPEDSEERKEELRSLVKERLRKV
jgi:hypothetical protein